MTNEPEPRQSQPLPPEGAARSPGDASQPPVDDEAVPRLPRGWGMKLSLPEIMRILMIAAMLIAVLVLRRPCAENTGRFVESFEPPVDAGPARTPGQLPPGRYIPLSGEMTEQELREKLELLTDIDAGPGPDPGAAQGAADDSSPGPAPGPATGAAPAHPSEDTSHDREPRNAPDRRPSSPSSAPR
ncbi:MAG TPA: hypothetical protein VNM90_17850 [Haliangium sp.]|nr:hypothetical protein [Haliangium sp.]